MGTGEVWGGEQCVSDEKCDWHANTQFYLREKERDRAPTSAHYGTLIKAPCIDAHAHAYTPPPQFINKTQVGATSNTHTHTPYAYTHPTTVGDVVLT